MDKCKGSPKNEAYWGGKKKKVKKESDRCAG